MEQEVNPQLNVPSEQVIGAAIEVHRHFGAGMQEATYQKALAVELELRGIPFELEIPVRLEYKGRTVGEGIIDVLVDKRLVVELKSAEANPKKYKRQVVAYLKATGLRLGLVINFESETLVDGVARVIH